jgi:hypothetical protein
MKVLVQWALMTPSDYIEIDSSEWATLPKKGLPGPSQLGGGNDDLGWVNRLNVQGIEFMADHYAVEHLLDGCRVTTWYDDPEDYSPGVFYARVWTFLDPAPDASLGGLMNTRQSQVVYAAPTLLQKFWDDSQGNGYENTELRPWDEFEPPDDSIIRHGVWLPEGLYAAHETSKVERGWREWVL